MHLTSKQPYPVAPAPIQRAFLVSCVRFDQLVIRSVRGPLFDVGGCACLHIVGRFLNPCLSPQPRAPSLISGQRDQMSKYSRATTL